MSAPKDDFWEVPPHGAAIITWWVIRTRALFMVV
jgi:hypothetical protein